MFDCDGVILNSNHIKSNGFYEACIDFGENCAKQIVNYHKLNGGISRYKKFEYFIKSILNYKFSDEIYQKLLYKYSDYVSNQLLKCKIAEKLEFYRNLFNTSNWYNLQSDQEELRDLFKKRSIDKYFDGGILEVLKINIKYLKNYFLI